MHHNMSHDIGDPLQNNENAILSLYNRKSLSGFYLLGEVGGKLPPKIIELPPKDFKIAIKNAP